MQTEVKDLIGRKVGNSQYKIIEYVTGGAYGGLYRGKHDETGLQVAIKCELKTDPQMQLPLEYRFYKILGSHSGVPKIYYFGECGDYHGLVMELLGPSVEKMHHKCGYRFSVGTTTKLAIQFIDILEYIHSKRVVFRDVKPENFLLGLPGSPTANKLHIIDFGLAKEFKDENGNHIPYREDKGVTGTARYMSVNAHQHKEQSRRDDLEAVGYVLVYLIKGDLPWQGLKVKSSRERIRKIGQIKSNTSVEVVCDKLPEEYSKYLHYARNLNFTEDPNYQYLRDLFKKLLSKSRDSNDYDWDRRK